MKAHEIAALKYAEILYNRFEEVRNIAAATNTPRQKMKVDHMIIAIALVNNASCIYSTDGGLKAFANGLIDVRDLPPIKQSTPKPREFQGSLSFEDNERDNDPF
jgi:hypothetical protein